MSQSALHQLSEYRPLTHWSWLQSNSAETSFLLKIPSNVSQGRNIAPIIKGGNGQRGMQPAAKKKSKSFIYLLIELCIVMSTGLSTLKLMRCAQEGEVAEGKGEMMIEWGEWRKRTAGGKEKNDLWDNVGKFLCTGFE